MPSERPPSPFATPPAPETPPAWTPQRAFEQLDAGDLKGAADGLLSAILKRPADVETEPLKQDAFKIPLDDDDDADPLANVDPKDTITNAVITFYRVGAAKDLREMLTTYFGIPDPAKVAAEERRRRAHEAHERSLEEERRRNPLNWRPDTTDPELFEQAMIQHFVVENPEIPPAEKVWVIEKLKKRGTFRDPKVPLSRISFEPKAEHGPTLVIRHRQLETFREGHSW